VTGGAPANRPACRANDDANCGSVRTPVIVATVGVVSTVASGIPDTRGQLLSVARED
jgi:hypothetical protein